MNKIITKDIIRKTDFKAGDLFRDPDGNVYVLSNPDGRYLAVRLSDGRIWNSAKTSIVDAIDGGLMFFKSDATIEIK